MQNLHAMFAMFLPTRRYESPDAGTLNSSQNLQADLQVCRMRKTRVARFQ